MSAMPETFEALLRKHESVIRVVVRDEAGVLLLRFDSVEDLVQGALQESLHASAALEWRGESAFRTWLATIARRHLHARREYWFAMKRNAGALLRLTLSGEGGMGRERDELADSATGPGTFAVRREQITLMIKALTMLLPRDREIVTACMDGTTGPELAERLGLSSEAAEKARARALERLRKTCVLLMRR